MTELKSQGKPLPCDRIEEVNVNDSNQEKDGNRRPLLEPVQVGMLETH